MNATGTAYLYRNAGAPTPLVHGISKVSVKVNARRPGVIRFSVTGKDGSYPVAPADVPLSATFVLDPPYATTNQCGEAFFSGPRPSCSYSPVRGLVQCS